MISSTSTQIEYGGLKKHTNTMQVYDELIVQTSFPFIYLRTID